ncbi:MAG: hypothetical protein IEMM0008_1934 [bacterium]|nr:MAG: hypothetical protein IEMM0008_1934 [bacterium]
MSKLIDQLKEEHTHLFQILGEVKALGISSKEGQEKLLSVKDSLLTHLKEEDDDLYPPLHKEAEKDDKLKGMLNLFINEMEEISRLALKFFDKYAHGGIGLDFARDFGELVAGLRTRMRREENILYAAYEKLNL